MGCGASNSRGVDADGKKTPLSFGGHLRAAEGLVRDNPKCMEADDFATLDRIAAYSNHKLVDNAVDGTKGSPRAGSENPVWRTWFEATDLVGAKIIGERILAYLLDAQPLAQIVFYGTSHERQAAAIARMIDQVVRMESESAVLVPALLTLGARHASYGFPPAMFSDMKNAAMAVLEDLLDGLSESEKEAWERVWRTVIDLMTHGVNSEAGVANTQRYNQDACRQVKAFWDQIRLKQDEFPAGDDRRLFSRVMYKKVLQKHPEFARFSNLTDFRTAERIMLMITQVVNDFASNRDPSQLLQASGLRHLAYDVYEPEMSAFEEPFLQTCEEYLGVDSNIRAMYLLGNFWKRMVKLMVAGQDTHDSLEASGAPIRPNFAIAFTDIEKSTRLWERYPTTMGEALSKHNRILRQLIVQYHGYEVKTIGDSFMVAFNTMTEAVTFACSIQTELMLQAPIAPGFRMVGPTQGTGPTDVWNDSTLRVRVGIEWCTEATPQYDAVHHRVDYFGPSINVAARVESAAGGGQVLTTAAGIAQLQREQNETPTLAPPDFVSLTDNNNLSPKDFKQCVMVALSAKNTELKGVGKPVDLFSISPLCLQRRSFNTSKKLDAIASVRGSSDKQSASGHSRRSGGTANSPARVLPGQNPNA